MKLMTIADVAERATWVRWFSAAFVIGLVPWIVSAAVLGVPHGVGHSIESMRWLETVRDVSLPLWLGGLAGIVGALALEAFHWFGHHRA